MKIAIDIDGTVADYLGAFQNYMSTTHGVDLPYPAQYNLNKAWPDLEGRYWDYHNEAVDDGLLLNIEPYPMAREVIDMLASEGNTIHVVTERVVEDDTLEWLNQSNFIFHDISFGTPKHLVGAEFIIDDDPLTLKACLARGIDILCPAHIYNINADVPLFQNWGHLYQSAQELRNNPREGR